MNSGGWCVRSSGRCRMIRAWREHFDRIPRFEEKPALKAVQLNGAGRPEGYDEWAKTNLYQQRQAGYYVATVTCPLGDLDIGPDAGAGGYRCVDMRAEMRGRPSSRTSCCDGFRMIRRSIYIKSWRPSGWVKLARGRLWMSSPARARTPASWGSPLRAVWPGSCGIGWRRRMRRWTRRFGDFESRSRAASIRAGSIMSRILASMATAEISTDIPFRISR